MAVVRWGIRQRTALTVPGTLSVRVDLHLRAALFAVTSPMDGCREAVRFTADLGSRIDRWRLGDVPHGPALRRKDKIEGHLSAKAVLKLSQSCPGVTFRRGPLHRR